jgi:hypothetical protein
MPTHASFFMGTLSIMKKWRNALSENGKYDIALRRRTYKRRSFKTSKTEQHGADF